MTPLQAPARLPCAVPAQRLSRAPIIPCLPGPNPRPRPLLPPHPTHPSLSLQVLCPDCRHMVKDVLAPLFENGVADLMKLKYASAAAWANRGGPAGTLPWIVGPSRQRARASQLRSGGAAPACRCSPAPQPCTATLPSTLPQLHCLRQGQGRAVPARPRGVHVQSLCALRAAHPPGSERLVRRDRVAVKRGEPRGGSLAPAGASRLWRAGGPRGAVV